MGKSTISMAIFNCYVSSPEGKHYFFQGPMVVSPGSSHFFIFFPVKSRSILLLAIWIPIYRFYSSSCWGWAAESFGWVRNGKRPESQVGPRVVHLSSIWGFLKWGILKTMGFNTKMLWWLDDLGCPHPRKPPYDSSIAFQHYPDVKHFAYDSMLSFLPGSRCIEEMNIW